MDPSAAVTVGNTGRPLVDGFSIDNSTGPLTDPKNTNTAAMPVQWLYVLKDGTIAAPTAGTGTSSVTVSGAGTLLPDGSTNDIVGRIAFWTDDETCKLNINTAAEGSYWDRPTFCTSVDTAFSQYQPNAREYTRYPGHPASTCLSPVLWSFFSSPQFPHPSATTQPWPTGPANYDTGAGNANPALPSYASNTFLPTVMTISPRNIWGGSQAGTVYTLVQGGNTVSISGVDNDRLYAGIQSD